MASIGKNIVQGLWNGVSGMVSWVKSKVSGFAKSILSSLKSTLGIHSPSKETAWFGEMLDRGLAQGVLDNMDAPLDAMTDLADGMLGEAESLNGVTLERQLQHTFQADVANQESGLLTKLDSILAAIERGQILTINGDALIGATADKYDNTLGQRRALVARGAI